MGFASIPGLYLALLYNLAMAYTRCLVQSALNDLDADTTGWGTKG